MAHGRSTQNDVWNETGPSGPSTIWQPGDLVFVGFNSRVAALDRESGELVWSWKSPKGSGFPALLLDGDRLIVSLHGYTYCLDPVTGEQLWGNPLKGFGLGIPCIASVNGCSAGSAAAAQAAAQEQHAE